MYKINEYTKTEKETISIETSSEKFVSIDLFKIFKVNAIVDPNEIVEIK